VLHSPSEILGEVKSLLPLSGFKPRTVQSVACSLYRLRYAVPVCPALLTGCMTTFIKALFVGVLATPDCSVELESRSAGCKHRHAVYARCF
jgi:hypothetical protein